MANNTQWMVSLLAVVAPLVAIPLTIITFYLRSLREHNEAAGAEQNRRLEAVEEMLTDLQRSLAEFERDYASKEEWLRECMHARRTIEQLARATTRHETLLSTALSGCRGLDEGRARSGTAAGHDQEVHNAEDDRNG